MPFSKLLIAATLVVVAASADVPTLTSKYCADVVEVRRGVTHVLTELRAFPLEYEAAISDAVVVCPPVPAPADFPFYLQPSTPPRPRPLAAPPDTSYTPPCLPRSTSTRPTSSSHTPSPSSRR